MLNFKSFYHLQFIKPEITILFFILFFLNPVQSQEKPEVKFGGGMLKQGWLEYDFNKNKNLQIGLTQVSFGITQHNSDNCFFNTTYCLGLENDHDIGIKYVHSGEKWEYNIAFLKKTEELNFGSYPDVSDSRYSYDISSIDLNNDGTPDFRYLEKTTSNFYNSVLNVPGFMVTAGNVYTYIDAAAGKDHS